MWMKISSDAIDYKLSKIYNGILDYGEQEIHNSDMISDVTRLMNWLLDCEPSYLLSDTEMYDTKLRYQMNMRYNFNMAELAYIGYADNEGSKLYLDNKGSEVRREIFETLYGRNSEYYHHINGANTGKEWEKVTSDQGGFFSGYTIAEYDVMFSYYRILCAVIHWTKFSGSQLLRWQLLNLQGVIICIGAGKPIKW